jgi:chemotaxis protein MotB
MARKAKKHEHVNHERWLVSYADFITLLFAFFVVMFAVSQVDSNKLGRFAESMNSAFLEGGIFTSARGTPVAQGGGGGSAIVQQIVGDRPSFMQYKSPSLQAEVLRDAVGQVLAQGGLKDLVTLRYDPRGVVLSVPEGALFAPYSADLSPAAQDKLDTLALAVGEAPGSIQVQTCMEEPGFSSSRRASPWDVGALRAARIAEHLCGESGLEPGRFSSATFAEPWPRLGGAEESASPVGRIELLLVTESGPPLMESP